MYLGRKIKKACFSACGFYYICINYFYRYSKMMKYLLLLIVIFILSACHSTLQQANERGLEQMKQNQYAEAITTFNTILKEKADWYPAYYNRAISHANLKQYNQALKDFNYFLANFPNRKKGTR